ncbi:hypothetical protein C9374_009335 [Naegleria lovaniensis]|uniref:Uncharacterized protein n=1 Tax=Naegleria lovaniensis TaxID=51637 RepID=A0AA88GDI9_NAELO|nr:uncharacterized protein C9374_009335 [Naegleria lovaniensis]KAG2377424.1 hypothetical protein C9374_009335 [Naegleria lovaniensis]
MKSQQRIRFVKVFPNAYTEAEKDQKLVHLKSTNQPSGTAVTEKETKDHVHSGVSGNSQTSKAGTLRRRRRSKPLFHDESNQQQLQESTTLLPNIPPNKSFISNKPVRNYKTSSSHHNKKRNVPKTNHEQDHTDANDHPTTDPTISNLKNTNTTTHDLLNHHLKNSETSNNAFI